MSGTKSKGRPKRTCPRPGWHWAIGFLLLFAGLALIAFNLVMEFGAPEVLPGGHNFVYLVSGIAIAFSSLWPFGWMDR